MPQYSKFSLNLAIVLRVTPVARLIARLLSWAAIWSRLTVKRWAASDGLPSRGSLRAAGNCNTKKRASIQDGSQIYGFKSVV